MSIERYFEMARNMSTFSNYKYHNIGCVVIYRNKVLSVGFNSTKTHPLQAKYNKERFQADTPHMLHAEITALLPIMDLNIEWSKVEMYIFRCHKNGNNALARPCKSCMKMIMDLGIKKIHYTTENGYATENIK